MGVLSGACARHGGCPAGGRMAARRVEEAAGGPERRGPRIDATSEAMAMARRTFRHVGEALTDVRPGARPAGLLCLKAPHRTHRRRFAYRTRCPVARRPDARPRCGHGAAPKWLAGRTRSRDESGHRNGNHACRITTMAIAGCSARSPFVIAFRSSCRTAADARARTTTIVARRT